MYILACSYMHTSSVPCTLLFLQCNLHVNACERYVLTETKNSVSTYWNSRDVVLSYSSRWLLGVEWWA